MHLRRYVGNVTSRRRRRIYYNGCQTFLFRRQPAAPLARNTRRALALRPAAKSETTAARPRRESSFSVFIRANHAARRSLVRPVNLKPGSRQRSLVLRLSLADNTRDLETPRATRQRDKSVDLSRGCDGIQILRKICTRHRETRFISLSLFG